MGKMIRLSHSPQKSFTKSSHSSHFAKVDIRMFLVEFSHIDKKKLVQIMDKAGYDRPFNLLEDMVFVKRHGWQMLRLWGFWGLSSLLTKVTGPQWSTVFVFSACLFGVPIIFQSVFFYQHIFTIVNNNEISMKPGEAFSCHICIMSISFQVQEATLKEIRRIHFIFIYGEDTGKTTLLKVWSGDITILKNWVLSCHIWRESETFWAKGVNFALIGLNHVWL